MSAPLVAWAYVNFNRQECAVLVSEGSPKNAPSLKTLKAQAQALSPDQARTLAQQLITSANFVESSLKFHGLETTHAKTH